MTTLDEKLERVVRQGVEDALAPVLRRLVEPECLTYTVPQAATVIGTSPTTVRRLIDEGHLPLVPHMGDRRLIPRTAVETFVLGRPAPPAAGLSSTRLEAVS